MVAPKASILSAQLKSTLKSGFPFLFREALLCHTNSRSAAQRTLDAAARMARRTEEPLFFLLRSAQAFEAAASRARGLRTSADILTEHPPEIFTEQ